MSDRYMRFVPGRVPDGPFSAEELGQQMDDGTITEEVKVCRVGDERWVPVRSVLGVHSRATPPPKQGSPTTRRHRPGRRVVAAAGAAIVGISALLVLYLVLRDKAAADLSRCRELLQSGKLADATAACRAAVDQDPESSSGKAASALLGEITATLGKLEATWNELPAECREGTAIPLPNAPASASEGLAGIEVHWKTEPETRVTVDDNTAIHCVSEGEATLTLRFGDVEKSRGLNVLSPLLGTWARRGDTLAGMRVRVQPGSDRLSGYIVAPPNDAALPFIAAIRKSDAVEPSLECAAAVWAPGLKKWDRLQRLDERRWSLGDLHKEYSTYGGCRETESKSRYDEHYELALSTPDRLEIRNLRAANVPQVWERTVELDDETLRARRTSCDEARRSALALWQTITAKVNATKKEVDDRFWAGATSLLGKQKHYSSLAAAVTKAKDAVSRGAYAARRTARAVPEDDELVELTQAKAASEAVFKECQDVLP